MAIRRGKALGSVMQFTTMEMNATLRTWQIRKPKEFDDFFSLYLIREGKIDSYLVKLL